MKHCCCSSSSIGGVSSATSPAGSAAALTCVRLQRRHLHAFSLLLLLPPLQELAGMDEEMGELAAQKREKEVHAKRIRDDIARVDEQARTMQARCGPLGVGDVGRHCLRLRRLRR